MLKLKIPDFLSSKKFWIPGLVVFLLIQTIAFISFIQVFVDYSHQMNLNTESGDNSFNTSVQATAKTMFRNDVVTDAKENKVYLPELKVSLPLSQLSRDLQYSYWQGDEVSPAALSLNTKNVLNTMPRPLISYKQTSWLMLHYYQPDLASGNSDISCLQHVARLSVNKQSELQQTEKAAGQIRLKDGRMFYLYKNGAPDCEHMWGSNDLADQIIDLLSQAQSY